MIKVLFIFRNAFVITNKSPKLTVCKGWVREFFFGYLEAIINLFFFYVKYSHVFWLFFSDLLYSELNAITEGNWAELEQVLKLKIKKGLPANAFGLAYVHVLEIFSKESVQFLVQKWIPTIDGNLTKKQFCTQ